jgi:hypothetical protein
MLWLLVYAIWAIRVCSGLQPGGGDEIITLTTFSKSSRTTVTNTASEIFAGAAPTSTTITSASSSPSGLITVEVTLSTIWSVVLEIPTTNDLGQSITVTEISTTISFYEAAPTTPGTTSKPPIPTNSVVSSEIWITTTNSLGETIITWHWQISTIPFE